MRYIKTFALLALVTLFAACTMLNEPISPAPDNSDLTQVRVTLDGNVRTLIPTIGDFSKIELSAAPAVGNTKPAPASVATSWEDYRNSRNGAIIPVPSGDWVITATLYTTVNNVDYKVIHGSAPVSISSWDSSVGVNITIHTPEAGNGTFSYMVNFPAGGSGTLKLQKFENGAITPTPAINATSITAGAKQTQGGLASGFYFLTVTGSNGTKTVTRNEIVHIYPQFTTEATYAFTKLEFSDNPYDSLNLGGRLNVTLNGQPVTQYDSIRYSFDPDYQYSYLYPNNNEWDLSFSSSDIGGATLYFRVSLNDLLYQVVEVPLPLVDKTDMVINAAFTITPTPLTANSWTDGTLASDETVNWYSVPVTAGTSYYFWWNDSELGDGTKTADVSVYALYSNGRSIWSSGYAWSSPREIYAESAPYGTTTVYIGVRTYSPDGGTYAIARSNNRYWQDFSVPLTAGTWYDGEFDNTNYEPDQFTMQVVAGEMYTIQWNNSYYGDDTKTGYVTVSAWDGSGYYFSNEGSGYANPQSFTARETGTVRVQVNWNNYGTYAIRYNRVDLSSAITLTLEQWKDGTFTAAGETHLYKIEMPANTNYYLYLNDSGDGNGTKTANVSASGSTDWSDFSATDAWSNPANMYSDTGYTVYIRVTGNGPGTYAIKISNSNMNPDAINTVLPLEETVDSYSYNGNSYYYINGTAGTTYYFWGRNNYGDPMNVTIYDSDGNFMTDSSSLWISPLSYTPSANGKIFIRVQTYGSYTIACSTNSGHMDNFSPIKASATPLTADQWEDSETTYNGEQWYSANVAASGTNYFWWNDYDVGLGKTARVNVQVYDSNGTEVGFYNTWTSKGEYRGASGTASTIYLKVTCYDYNDYPPTYGIVYSTTDVRPAISFTRELGNPTIENDGNQKGWEGGNYGLSWEAVASAKYLILKIQDTVNKDGFGGIQLGLLGDGTDWHWVTAQIAPNWTDFSTTSADTTYIVIDLDTVSGTTSAENGSVPYDWSDFAAPNAGAGKFFIGHYGTGGFGFAALGVANAYLSNEAKWATPGAVTFAQNDGVTSTSYIYKDASESTEPLYGYLYVDYNEVSLGTTMYVNYNSWEYVDAGYYQWSVVAYDDEDGDTKTRNFYTQNNSFTPDKYAGEYTVTMFATGRQSVSLTFTVTAP